MELKEQAKAKGYVRIGHGDRQMVLLPGLAFRSTLSSAVLVEASYGKVFRDYTIWLLDDRSGIGEGYTIRRRAEDVADLMRSLHLHDAYVYGVSMGGMVGQRLAIDHPELVKKLALTATAPCLGERARQVLTAWQTLAEAGEAERAIHQMVSEIYAPDTLAAYGRQIEEAFGPVSEEELRQFVLLTRAILAFDCREELKGIRCPVLAIGSRGDRALTPEGTLEIAGRLGCEQHLYGEEYGHAVYDEAPDIKQRILAFFDREEPER